jgi:GTP1/Obg family GTP-binding protein
LNDLPGLVLFVVDASEKHRFGEARLALEKALKECNDSSLLVLANKQDEEVKHHNHIITKINQFRTGRENAEHTVPERGSLS